MTTCRTTRSAVKVSAALMSLAAAGRAAAQTDITREPQTTEIAAPVSVPMDLSFQKPAIEARINGKGPFRFFLDTGAAVTVLNDDLVTELSLPVTGKTQLGDPMSSSAINADVAKVDSIQIGGAVFRDLKATSWDRSTLYGGVPDAPRGVLGMPLFRDSLLTLDYPTQTVRIENGALPGPDAPDVVSLEPDPMSLFVIPIDVGGVALHAYLDSGNMGGLMLPKSYAEKLPLAGELVQVGQARTVANTFAIWRATLDGDVLIAGNRIEKPELFFNDAMNHVIIGYDTLRRFAVTLDQKNRRMRLTEVRDTAGRVKAAPKSKRYGIRAAPGPEQDAIDVAGVDPDSPAERAGLRAGDRITAIGDKSVASMSFSDISHAMHSSPITLTVQRGEETLTVHMSLDDAPTGG